VRIYSNVIIQVLVITTYAKLLILGEQCRYPITDELLESVRKPLEDAFNDLAVREAFDDALRVAWLLRSWPKLPASEKFLIELSQCTALPRLLKAKIQLRLAESLENANDIEGSEELLSLALVDFTDAEHAYGALDIGTLRAIRARDETQLAALIKSYEKLNYFSGLHSLLLKLLTTAASMYMFDLQTSIAEDLEKISAKTGSKLLQIMTRLQTLALWSWPGFYNTKVAAGGAAFYESLEGEDLVYFRGQAANLVAYAYINLKNYEKASEWARKCEKNWARCKPEDQSDGATLSLVAAGNLITGREATLQLCEKGQGLIESDIELGKFENAVEKMDVIIQKMTAYRAQFSNQINQMLDRRDALLASLPAQARDQKRANGMQFRATILLSEAKDLMNFDRENRALDLLNETVQLHIQQGKLWEGANCRLMGGICHWSMYDKIRKHIGATADAERELRNALALFTLARDAYIGIKNESQIGNSNYWVARCCFELWSNGWIEDAKVLELIAAAEESVEARRSGSSVLHGLDIMTTMTAKQSITSDEHATGLYRFATQICLLQGNVREAWKWIQRAKARSLNDMLGETAAVPETLLADIARDPEAQKLWEKVKELEDAISACNPLDRFALLTELEKVQLMMRENPILGVQMARRGSLPVTIEELQFLSVSSAASRKPMAAVDWIVVGNLIHIAVVNDQADPIILPLSLKIADLQAWTEEYLNTEDGREALFASENDELNPLRQLDGLIAPLKTLSAPGDLLVFCPTNLLHSLPLHALKLDNDLSLIKRNPIVYTASLTSFYQCCSRIHSIFPSSPRITKKAIVAIYEPSLEEEWFDEQEQRKIISAARDIATIISAEEPLIGQDVTPESFKRVMEESQLVYFHGHCDASSSSIEKQSLRLSNGNGVTGLSFKFFPFYVFAAFPPQSVSSCPISSLLPSTPTLPSSPLQDPSPAPVHANLTLQPLSQYPLSSPPKSRIPQSSSSSPAAAPPKLSPPPTSPSG
jgi:CHAT domain-containing protein